MSPRGLGLLLRGRSGIEATKVGGRSNTTIIVKEFKIMRHSLNATQKLNSLSKVGQYTGMPKRCVNAHTLAISFIQLLERKL